MIDREAPLPPPLLCPGQVWLQASGKAMVLGFPAQGRLWTPFDPDAPPETVLAVMKMNHPLYLLFDPCTPSQAPWAPPETA